MAALDASYLTDIDGYDSEEYVSFYIYHLLTIDIIKETSSDKEKEDFEDLSTDCPKYTTPVLTPISGNTNVGRKRLAYSDTRATTTSYQPPNAKRIENDLKEILLEVKATNGKFESKMEAIEQRLIKLEQLQLHTSSSSSDSEHLK